MIYRSQQRNENARRLIKLILFGQSIIFIFLLGCGSAKSQRFESDTTVVIDAAQQYQTIDGFGGTEHWTFPPENEYSKIFDDLGVSILRFRMLRYTESKPDKPGDESDNDNDDPFIIDWNNVKTEYFGGNLGSLLKAAQSRGVKLFGNIMCPPPWMKTSNIAEGKGSLKADYEDELIEFILIWIKGMYKYHDVQIDYINFENEPNYQRGYPSCYMSPSQISDLTKRMGERFKAEGITTKIITPETSNLKQFIGYAKTICSDHLASSYAYRLATHSYNINFFKPEENNDRWIRAYNLANLCDKGIWLTEYCLDYDNSKKGTWNEAIILVQHVHNALVYGRVSAWIYHELYMDPSKSPIALIDKDKHPYPKFYTMKQYFRYVRPESVRVVAESNSNDILATSFVHKEDKTFTIVVINRAKSDKKVSFVIKGINGISELVVVRTSAFENSADLGKIMVDDNSSFIYILPKESVTTFTSNMT